MARFIPKHRFVLVDKSIGVFIGRENCQISFEESADKALVFDERDNMGIKARFYNAVTGLNLGVMEI